MTAAPEIDTAAAACPGGRPHPRVAVVSAVLGIPSEVWMLRQARAFTRITPVLIGGECAPDAELSDFETRLVPGVFGPPRGVMRKGARRLGLAGAYGLGPAQAAALATALKESRAEVALCHFTWTAMAVAQAAPSGMPLIWHAHGRDVSSMLNQPAYRAMLARQLPRAAALVTVGHHQMDRLTPFGLPSRRAVIPCGAPRDLFEGGQVPDQTAGRVRFISVGRLSPEKGMMETLQAFESVASDLPHAELVLVGYGPLIEVLRARISASPVRNRVRLTGRLTPDAIAGELAAAQVYMQHSREVDGWVEGFGVTLAEAGAAGLPLLASASGGLIDQIEEGENGYLFPPGDVAAQARLMRVLAADPERRAEMGARARVLAARFDTTAMAKRLEDEILAVIAERKHHG